MEFTVILQELWRRRIVVGIALLISIGAGILLAYRVTPGLPPHFQSRQHEVGKATARLLVDTPNSLVADLNPAGAASLSVHAQLLGDLIASDPIRAEIARSAGIPQQTLAVVPPSIGAPVGTPNAQATAPPSASSTLNITVADELPLVSIAVTAPSQAQAAKLATSAIDGVRNYLLSVAAAQKIPPSRQPVVKSLGITSSSATAGPSRMLAAGVTIVLFFLMCYALLMTTGIRRRLRAVRMLQDAEQAHDSQPEPDTDERDHDDLDQLDWHQPSRPSQGASAPSITDGVPIGSAVTAASEMSPSGAVHSAPTSLRKTSKLILPAAAAASASASGHATESHSNGDLHPSHGELGASARRGSLLAWKRLAR